MDLVVDNVLQKQAVDMLYNLAIDCEDHKARETCNYKCKDCGSNISLYGISPQEAALLTNTAAKEVQQRISISHSIKMQRLQYARECARDNRIAKASMFLLFFMFAALVIWFVHAWNDPKYQYNPPPEQSVVPVEPFINYLPAIWETCTRIYKADMNNDGLINCIDYAIQFYNAYPTRAHIRILVNHNYNKDFHHLFVSVGGYNIEPGSILNATDKDNIQGGVQDFWGDLYDPRYDTDVTEHWEKIRVNKYRW